MKCEQCNQEIHPTLEWSEYMARATLRFAKLDRLVKKIDFSQKTWSYTPEGKRWQRLMDEQRRDEVAAGL